jgi:WD40 repeat protein
MKTRSRDLELKAGHKSARGQKGTAHAYNLKSQRDQERRWVEQGETAYARFVVRHQGPVTVATFDSTGMRVVTASEDKTARIWDARTGEPIGKPLQHRGPVTAADYAACARALAPVMPLWHSAPGLISNQGISR